MSYSPESMVKDLLRRLNAESQAQAERIPDPATPPTEPATPPSTGGGAMGKAAGRDAAFAMAGLMDAIQSSKALEGLQDAVKIAKSLKLRKGSMGDRGVSALARAFRDGDPSALQHLDLSDNSVAEQGMRELTRVVLGGALSNLEHLDLSHNLLRDEGSGMLADVLHIGRLPSLKHLNLSHSYIGDTGARSLADAMLSSEFTSWGLEFLDMSANVFGDDGVVALSRALSWGRLPFLKHLNLSYNSFGKRGTEAFASLLNLGQLAEVTHLLLSRCYLGDCVVPISQAMAAGRLPKLQFLDITSNALGDQGSLELARALKSGRLSRIQHLALSECGIPAERGEVITEAMAQGGLRGLRHLDLSNNFTVPGSSSTGSDFSAGGGGSSAFGRKYLNSVRVDSGSMALARLMRAGYLQGLRHLDLSRCCMTDEGLIALAEEMEGGSLPKLQRFLCTDNDIRAERSLRAVVRALESGQVPDLQELELGYNSLGDDVAMALARAVGSNSSAVESPLVKKLREKLLSSQSPMEVALYQIMRFIETSLGIKLRQTQRTAGASSRTGTGTGNGNGIWKRYVGGGAAGAAGGGGVGRSSLAKDETEPKESMGNDSKMIFSALLVCVWFVAVLVSHS